MKLNGNIKNQGELKKVVVEPNKTIEVTLDNKPQKGQLSLIKKEESK